MALRSLAQGFSNWSKSRKGERKGRRVGFPKFKSKNTTMQFAYSTDFTAPTASDPYGLKLPRIGRVHCMENVYKRVAGAHLVRVSVSRRAVHCECGAGARTARVATRPRARRRSCGIIA